MENSIKYSILIPAYNAEKYISRSITSAVNQTTQSNYEIIVCDDGCVDKTVDIIKSFNCNKIKILTNETNQGGIITRKKLLLEAQGKYILWLDADDDISLETLSIMDKELNEYDYDIIDFNYNDVFIDKYYEYKKDKRLIKNQSLINLFFNKNNNCYLWGQLLKREICIKYLPDDYHFSFDDIFFIMPIYYYARSYKTLSLPLYNYYRFIGYWSHQYQNQITITKKEFLNQMEARRECFYHNYKFLYKYNIHELYADKLCSFVDFKDLFLKLLKVENVEDRMECMGILETLFQVNGTLKL